MVNYETCRWCKHYENGCTNEDAFDLKGIDFTAFFENGHLAEAIMKGIGLVPLNEDFWNVFEDAKISDDYQFKLVRAIIAMHDDLIKDRSKCIVENVSRILNDYILTSSFAIPIKNPDNFNCKYFT